MKRWRGKSAVRSIGIAAAAGLSAAAQAQAPPPVGLWQGESSGDFILVQADGACSASGSYNMSGSCTWQPTGSGGILTMQYQWTIGPGYTRWSITWMDNNVILVNGVERFFRRG